MQTETNRDTITVCETLWFKNWKHVTIVLVLQSIAAVVCKQSFLFCELFWNRKRLRINPAIHYSICAVTCAQLHDWHAYAHNCKCGNVFHPALTPQFSRYHYGKGSAGHMFDHRFSSIATISKWNLPLWKVGTGASPWDSSPKPVTHLCGAMRQSELHNPITTLISMSIWWGIITSKSVLDQGLKVGIWRLRLATIGITPSCLRVNFHRHALIETSGVSFSLIASPSCPRSTAISSWRSHSNRPMKQPKALWAIITVPASLALQAQVAENPHHHSSDLFFWSLLESSPSRPLSIPADEKCSSATGFEPEGIEGSFHCSHRVDLVQAFHWHVKGSNRTPSGGGSSCTSGSAYPHLTAKTFGGGGKCTTQIGLRSQNHV